MISHIWVAAHVAGPRERPRVPQGHGEWHVGWLAGDRDSSLSLLTTS